MLVSVVLTLNHSHSRDLWSHEALKKRKYYIFSCNYFLFPHPGPRGSCGHALFPPLRHGGRPHLSVRLPGRLQRSLSLGSEAGSLLWDLPARRPHLHLQHYDAGDGVRRRHWRKRLPGLLQCRKTTCGRCGHVIPQASKLIPGFSCDKWQHCDWKAVLCTKLQQKCLFLCLKYSNTGQNNVMYLCDKGHSHFLLALSSFFIPTENQFCGGRLIKSQGSVKTPNWPNSNYPAGISCSWHISVEPSNVSTLYIWTELNVSEVGHKCCEFKLNF